MWLGFLDQMKVLHHDLLNESRRFYYIRRVCTTTSVCQFFFSATRMVSTRYDEIPEKNIHTYIEPQYINTGKVSENLDLFWHMFHNLTIVQNVWDCAKRVEIVSNWGERKSVASRVIDFREKKRHNLRNESY